MTKTTQQKKCEWEKRHVQRVINYYNSKFKTRFKIKGKAEDIYPDLKKSNRNWDWDWVCHDTSTGEEIAIEVKQLTDQQKEYEYGMVSQILTEVLDRINKAELLKGIYLLSAQIQLNKALLFGKKRKRDNNIIEFKDIVYRIICESAKLMKPGEEKLLTPLLKQQLSFELPDLISLSLHKSYAEGSLIGKGFGIWSGKPAPNELSDFQELVTGANKQLGIAKPRKTILVIIEEGFRHTVPETLSDAFSKINHECYSSINSVYLISGDKVVEIPLLA